MTHEATALHIRNFYNGECAKRLGREMLIMSDRSQQNPQQEQMGNGGAAAGGGGGGGNTRKNWKINTPRGLESSDVMTVGEHMPFNVAYSSSADMGNRNGREDVGRGLGGSTHCSNTHKQRSSLIDEYFEGVHREFRVRRQPKKLVNDNSSNNNDRDYYYHPLWPLDKLRLELEEAWPSGAGLAREDGKLIDQTSASNKKDSSTDSKSESKVRYARPYGGGLPRIMQGPTRWKRGFIHVDELGPLDSTRGLFSANIYLTVPESTLSGGIDSGTDDEGWKKDAGALHVWPLGVRSRWDWYRVSKIYKILLTQMVLRLLILEILSLVNFY